MSHGDRVVAVPPGFKVIAASDNAPLAAMADESRRLYGLQFHPEVTHTLQGGEILRRFVREIAGCAASWATGNIIEDSVARIRAQVGTDQVLLGLSGGVDSSVLAALLHRAIGAQLTCVFVDHGLLRLGEGDQVMATFAEHMGVQRHSRRCRAAILAGSSPARRIRRRSARSSARVHRGVRRGSGEAQGREMAGAGHDLSGRDRIGGRKDRQSARHQIAPQRRRLAAAHESQAARAACASCSRTRCASSGVELGLPTEMVHRHPFPGPGLGVRILGEIHKSHADLLRRADAIFIEELRRHDLYDKVSQAFAVFLPVSSVGVMGDGRRYDHVIALRAVETIDFMTARWARLPYEFLDRVAHRIINEVPGISRVVYDISGKPPATIEWE